MTRLGSARRGLNQTSLPLPRPITAFRIRIRIRISHPHFAPCLPRPRVVGE